MKEKCSSLDSTEDYDVTGRNREKNRDILLICSSREEALVPYAILSESTVLKTIVDTPVFKEARDNAIFLPISYLGLKRIVEYLWYKHNYHKNNGEVGDFKIEDSETLDLLEVSAFLRL